MMWQFHAPQTDEQWLAYYHLRWQVLRAPWSAPKGSEQDECESQSFHMAAWTEDGEIAAVGRLHLVNEQEAQVRYMAVAPQWQGKGLGAKVLERLEQQALCLRVMRIVLNARETAAGFYQRLGYQYVEPTKPLFGIAHDRYAKTLGFAASAETLLAWQEELQQTWQRRIPLSRSMQLRIHQLSAWELETSLPLAPNVNVHDTVFAGSIYSAATLTGWGVVWALLKDAGIAGDIVLADASIRYLKPVQATAMARCKRPLQAPDFSALKVGGKVRVPLLVECWCEGQLSAEFKGQYVIITPI